jgi:hypothetical protein
MSVTLNNIRVDYDLNPPTVTFLQECSMSIPAIHTTLRSIEESDIGHAQPFVKMVQASGNQYGAAMSLQILPPYAMQFEAGVIGFSTSNGNLRGTFLQSAGAIVQINNATEYLTVATGSGLSTAEHDQLMALSTANLDAPVSGVPAATRTNLAVELSQITEQYKLDGLDASNPLFVTTTSRNAGAISQTIADAGGTVTVHRV